MSLGLRPPRRSKSMAMHSVTVQGCNRRREPVDVCPRVVAAEIRECACPRDVSEAELERANSALPDRPLLQGRPPGVSTPVYEKIRSQFKGTHDQRFTERCDVPSRGLGRNRPQPEPRTQADAIEHATNGSAAPPRAAHRASSFGVAVCARDKIQNKSCCVCRLQSGARCGPPPVGRPPSALQQRAASMLRWHFTLQRGRIAGYSLR